MPQIFPRGRRYSFKDTPAAKPDPKRPVPKPQATDLTKKKMPGLKLISSFFKVVHYGRGEPITQRTVTLEDEFREFVEYQTGRSRSQSTGRRPPSAPSTRKPPVIRIRKDRSLNGSVWGSPQQVNSTSDSTTATDIVVPVPSPIPKRKPRKRSRSMKKKPPSTDSSEAAAAAVAAAAASAVEASFARTPSRAEMAINTGSHLEVEDGRGGHRSRSQERRRNSTASHETMATTTTSTTGKTLSAYAEEAEKFVRAAIEVSRPIDKQVIRIINGYQPTIQSQVLLNTKTTQPWDELVRDLGMAVKLPKGRGSCMETISGRKIQSYSQLRTELLAGNLGFYIYPEKEEGNELGMPPLTRNLNARLSDRSLGKATPPVPSHGKRKSVPAIQPHFSESTGHSTSRSSIKIDNSGSIAYLATPIPVSAIHKSFDNLQDTETKYRRSSVQPMMHVGHPAYGHGHAIRYASSVTHLDPNGNAEFGHFQHFLTPTEIHSVARSNPSLATQYPPEQVSTGVQTLDVPSKKRESRRRRSEASVYLASARRSRSISPP